MKFNIDEKYRNSSGIYIIRALNCDRCYIGSTVNLRKRWQSHRSSLKSRIHYNTHLSNFVKKYGINSLIFELLELVEEKNDLLLREQNHIDKYDFEKLFNIQPTAGSSLGLPNTLEQKRKISLAVSGEKNGFYGKKHSKKTRKLMSLRHSRRKPTGKQLEFLKKANRHKKVSKITREKLSKSSSSHTHSKMVKNKIARNHGFSKSVKLWKDGEFVGQFSSITKACEFAGNSRMHVSKSLRENNGVFEIKGYRYEMSNQEDLIRTKGRPKKIYLYKNGKFYKEFDSIVAVCKFTKNARSHVSEKMRKNNGVFIFAEFEYRFSKRKQE